MTKPSRIRRRQRRKHLYAPAQLFKIDMARYIKEFSNAHHLKPSPFLINGEEVVV